MNIPALEQKSIAMRIAHSEIMALTHGSL